MMSITSPFLDCVSAMLAFVMINDVLRVFCFGEPPSVASDVYVARMGEPGSLFLCTMTPSILEASPSVRAISSGSLITLAGSFITAAVAPETRFLLNLVILMILSGLPSESHVTTPWVSGLFSLRLN